MGGKENRKSKKEKKKNKEREQKGNESVKNVTQIVSDFSQLNLVSATLQLLIKSALSHFRGSQNCDQIEVLPSRQPDMKANSKTSILETCNVS